MVSAGMIKLNNYFDRVGHARFTNDNYESSGVLPLPYNNLALVGSYELDSNNWVTAAVTRMGTPWGDNPFDASKVEDPSLIIYAAARTYQNNLIVTNGDQTDTVYEGLQAGKGFAEALRARAFEPDAPNLTPRISAMLTFAENDFTYQMSILKSADAEGTACNRYTFDYAALPGLGHFIHTYVCDGNPIPTFQGEPERVAIPNDIDAFTTALWNALDADNKISLFVRYTDLATGETEDRILNKNQ